MRSRWFLRCMGLVAMFGVASCDDERTAETPLTPYGKFMRESAYIHCEELAVCCAGTDFSVASCRSWFRLELELGDPAVTHEGEYVFHQDRADRCLTDLRARDACDGIEPVSCLTVTEGKLAGGDACKSNPECPSSDRTLGRCFPAEEDTLRCDFPGRAAAPGEACFGSCDDSHDCFGYGPDTDAFCYRDTGLMCEAGTCRNLAAVGAPCDGSDTCVDEALCSMGTCVAKVGLGGACTTSAECGSESYCEGGTCGARLPAGSPCDEDVLDSCLRGSCLEGECFVSECAVGLVQ